MIRLRTDGVMTEKGFQRFKKKDPSRRDRIRAMQKYSKDALDGNLYFESKEE